MLTFTGLSVKNHSCTCTSHKSDLICSLLDARQLHYCKAIFWYLCMIVGAYHENVCYPLTNSFFMNVYHQFQMVLLALHFHEGYAHKGWSILHVSAPFWLMSLQGHKLFIIPSFSLPMTWWTQNKAIGIIWSPIPLANLKPAKGNLTQWAFKGFGAIRHTFRLIKDTAAVLVWLAGFLCTVQTRVEGP